MTATQAVGGLTTWSIDNIHSSVEFSVRHMMVSTARGAFRTVAGTIVVDEANPHLSSVEVSVDVASIDTREERRDAHLRSRDFFDVERFPTIEFRSRRVEPMGGDRYRLTGELTMHGVTREITFDASYLGRIADSKLGVNKAGFEGELTLDRRDFGLTYNAALETGGVAVGHAVKVSLHIEADRAA